MRTIAGRLDRTDDPWAGMPRRRYGVAGLARRLGELPDRAGEEGRPRR
jgi:hypothetical protein